MKPIHYIYTLILATLISCTNKNVEQAFDQKPSDSKASELLKNYHQTLCLRLNEGIMLGHQDAMAYGSMWFGEEDKSDVKSIYGENPAVVDWKLTGIDSELTINSESIAFNDIKKYIIDLDKVGGITTLTWNPDNFALSDKNATPFSLSKKEDHNKYISALDSIAAFLSELKNSDGENIPVILRILTLDNTKDSLWHGKSAETEYKKLWSTAVDYLRQEKKIHHVLFAYSMYNPSSLVDISNYYPGDEYIDIIGADLYLNIEEDSEGARFQERLDKNLALITDFASKHNKIPALTETGLKGVKISNFFSAVLNPVLLKYKISYVMFGRNAWNIEDDYYIPVPGHPATDDFLKFANEPHILIGDKITNKS